MMKSKTFRNIITGIIYLVFFIQVPVYGEVQLKDLLGGKRWQEMETHFLDKSFKALEAYFSSCRSITVIASSTSQISYNAKFARQGEIGVITFKKSGEKYLEAKILNQIRPLYFIEKFKKYRANNVILNVGDARVHFISGYLYHPQPFSSLVLFEGSWKFSIKPSDKEEQLTLKRKFRRDYLSRTCKTGLFILEQQDFFKELPLEGETVSLKGELHKIYHRYRTNYGIHIKQFDEYWYLPFPDGTNLVVFEESKGVFYSYSYNISRVPDTQLSISGSNDILLSYNAHKGLKLSFGGGESPYDLSLNLFYNPAKNYIAGTSDINFKNPAMLRIIQLAPGLDLNQLKQESSGLNVFRKKDKYYLMGAQTQNLSLYFKGEIKPGTTNFEIFKSKSSEPIPASVVSDEAKDRFYFLSKNSKFYPSPGSQFARTKFTVSLPGGLNCLASGNLVEKRVAENAVYTFSSPGTKGISLAVGNFKLRKKITSTTALHVYTHDSLSFPRRLDLDEVQEAMDFLSRKYGKLELPVINLLIKRGQQEGGVSNSGFVIINLPFTRKRTGQQISLNTYSEKIYSPVLIRNTSEDHIIHELAHQWWGGVISWKSYHDLWLTEGLAHFSVLYYLQSKLSKKRFMRLVRKLKRWVYKYSETGPVIYGTRINMLEKNYEAYQAVIYSKSALIFLMARQLIGEEEFSTRLQNVLQQSKYKSLASSAFIRMFCGNDKRLSRFFKQWIYSRAIPQLQLKLLEKDKENDTKSFTKVVISIEQLGEGKSFVIPVKLKVVTKKGTTYQDLVLTEKSHRFLISRESSIRSIDLQENVSLFKEKRAFTLPNSRK